MEIWVENYVSDRKKQYQYDILPVSSLYKQIENINQVYDKCDLYWQGNIWHNRVATINK